MAEMKDAINALGEFQELKSQVKRVSIKFFFQLSLSTRYTLQLPRNAYPSLTKRNW